MHDLYFIGEERVILSNDQNESINKKIEVFIQGMSTKGQSKDYVEKQRNASSFIEDTCFGKKGECLALKFLVRRKQFPPTNIDWKVRRGNDKGWVKDLDFNNVLFPNIDVKTCSQKTLKVVKEMTWTFQLKNKQGVGGRDPILDSDGNDIVAFVFAHNHTYPHGEIMALLPFKSIKEYLKPPKLEQYKDLKICIYYKDLLENKEKILCSL